MMKTQEYCNLMRSVFTSPEGALLLEEWDKVYNSDSCFQHFGDCPDNALATVWRDGRREIVLEIKRAIRGYDQIESTSSELPF